MPPLRGLWNSAPAEGDRFVNAELDWLSSPPGSAVQFQLAGSSPVAISQIVALAVDNAASGADVQFIFPDSGFVLSVPARTSGIFPVFTNALMFYAAAPSAILGDKTVFQAFNSMPPPVPVPASLAQNAVTVTGIAMVAGTTQVIPTGVNGTLNTLSVSANPVGGAAAAELEITLIDGGGKIVWAGNMGVPPNGNTNPTYDLTNLSLRFTNGLSALISNVSGVFSSGFIVVNAFYSKP